MYYFSAGQCNQISLHTLVLIYKQLISIRLRLSIESKKKIQQISSEFNPLLEWFMSGTYTLNTAAMTNGTKLDQSMDQPDTLWY